MKLASLMHGRDGRLVVVSQDLTRATDAFPVVPTLQAALDDWDRMAPRLADLAVALEHGAVPSFRFHEHDCASPLPRAYGRLVAGRPDGALVPARSDGALGPREPVRARDESAGLIAEAGLAFITADVARDAARTPSSTPVRLVMLACQVAASHRPGGEALQADDPVAREQAFSFSPVAVTPDDLGTAWRDGRVHLPLLRQINQQVPQRGDAGAAADPGGLIVGIGPGQGLCAGTILVTIVPIPQEQPLRFGDTVRIEMKDAAGHSIFGAIEQDILPAG